VLANMMRCKAAARRKPLVQLLVPQGRSQAGDAITLLLLAELVVLDGGGATTGQLLRAVLAAVTPIVIVGPLAGMVADRWPRRRILIVGHIARSAVTAVAVLVPLTGETWIGYVVVGALLAVTRTVYTCRAAVLPHLVGRDELVVADSLVLMVGMVAGLAGAAIGSAAIWTVPEAGVAVAATAHLLAAHLYRALPADLGGGAVDARTDAISGWRIALAELRAPRVAAAISSTMLCRGLVGAGVATVAQLVNTTYSAGAPGYAATLGVASVGAFAGTLTAARASTLSDASRLIGSCVVGAVAFLVAALWSHPALGLWAVACASFGFQNVRVCADATVQAGARDVAIGRAFAVYDVLYNVAFAVGAVGALGLAMSTADGTVLTMIGALYIAGGLACLAGAGRGRVNEGTA
jgi:hypothetical protein